MTYTFKVKAMNIVGNGKMLFHAYTMKGEYIGNIKWAMQLTEKGVTPQLGVDIYKNDPDHEPNPNRCCSIGFCEKEQKWYGWSQRTISSFGVGDVVKEGDCTASVGVTQECLKEHPEYDISLPVGFKAKTLEDARKMAEAFAESVG